MSSLIDSTFNVLKLKNSLYHKDAIFYLKFKIDTHHNDMRFINFKTIHKDGIFIIQYFKLIISYHEIDMYNMSDFSSRSLQSEFNDYFPLLMTICNNS